MIFQDFPDSEACKFPISSHTKIHHRFHRCILGFSISDYLISRPLMLRCLIYTPYHELSIIAPHIPKLYVYANVFLKDKFQFQIPYKM